MVLAVESRTAALWESFWTQAGVHGCTAAFPPDAQAAIANAWARWFQGLAPSFSLLDVATGAGAVLDHALRAHRGKSLDLVGVDLVSISPARAPAKFIGGIDADDLPFRAREFDYVTSQFGIEYGSFEAALSEAARVCDRGLKFLMHASDGVVIRQNILQAEQCAWMIDDLDLRGRLHQQFSQSATREGLTVEALLKALQERGQGSENVSLLEAVYAAVLEARELWTRGQSQAARDSIDGLVGQLGEHRDRMCLLGRAGIDQGRLDAGAALLRDRGFDTRTADQRSGAHDHLIGYWLEANRAGTN